MIEYLKKRVSELNEGISKLMCQIHAHEGAKIEAMGMIDKIQIEQAANGDTDAVKSVAESIGVAEENIISLEIKEPEVEENKAD